MKVKVKFDLNKEHVQLLLDKHQKDNMPGNGKPPKKKERKEMVEETIYAIITEYLQLIQVS